MGKYSRGAVDGVDNSGMATGPLTGYLALFLGCATSECARCHQCEQRDKSVLVWSQISSGVTHSAALTDSGQIYVWGCGREGQLGLGHLNSPRAPHCVEALLGHNVVQIECGEYHMVVLTDSNVVFSWGDGAQGQLGHPDIVQNPQGTIVQSPRQVLALSPEALNGVSILQVSSSQLLYVLDRMLQVCCGELHTAALTVAGELFTFGRNSNCQLGLTTNHDCEPLPVRVDGALQAVEVRQQIESCHLNLAITQTDRT